jgi:hypothetical protein
MIYKKEQLVSSEENLFTRRQLVGSIGVGIAAVSATGTAFAPNPVRVETAKTSRVYP